MKRDSSGKGKEIEPHRTSEELGLEEVSQYFSSLGYKDVKLNQVWRHVTGVAEKEGEKRFIKLATTKGVADRTQNEYAWNELVNSTLTSDLSVHVPKVYEKGDYDGLFWFTSEYIDGHILSQPDGTRVKDLKENLPLIANITGQIMSIDTEERLPHDAEEIDRGVFTEKIFEKLDLWGERITRDVEDLYGFLQENVQSLQLAPSHGDFTPWHFMQSEKGLYLIDAEHAHILGVKYYDVAYFYHRVYTKLKEPEIAEDFLTEYLNMHPLDTEEERAFVTILAQRVYGGYMDAELDGVTSFKLQDELRDRVLTGRILA